MKKSLSINDSKIIFFDGVCNLCNGFVDFLLPRTEDLYFAPLQGTTAEELFPGLDPSDLGTVIFWNRGHIETESSAVLGALAESRRYLRWSVLILRLVPRFFRDGVYRFIARHRLKWFGRRRTCRMPTPEETVRFLP